MLKPWTLDIKIHRDSSKAVYLQIADAVTEAIRTGKLKGGDPLPGGRKLAAYLHVNRNTIIDALDLLIADGWIVSHERKGIFVSGKFRQNDDEITGNLPEVDVRFDDGLPDVSIAPMKELSRYYRQFLIQHGRWNQTGYYSELGHPEFREAAAQLLRLNRGMEVDASQICVTRGSQMALYLSAQCLINPGDVIVVENPGYKPAWNVFTHAGARILPVPVDGEGMVVDRLEELLEELPGIRGVYITPHHQFPTTVSLSRARRNKLIELSDRYGFTIIEDDYDHEFRFEKFMHPSGRSLNTGRNHIYLGTFSKIVSPVLRIGFLVGHPEFVRRAGQLRSIIDVQGDSIMEQAVLQLIRSGEIRRHVRRALETYRTKRDFFGMLLHKYLLNKAEFRKPEGGLAYWIKPTTHTDLFQLNRKLLERGVMINTPDSFSFGEPVYGLRLGYASLGKEEMEKGISAISQLL